MNEIREVLSKYNYKIEKLVIKDKISMIDTNNDRFVIKKKDNPDINEIYSYLNNKKFNNYLKYINNNDDKYMLFPYLKDTYFNKEEKAKDIISIVSLLHSKTTFYKSFYQDEIKEIYETNIEKINSLYTYYNDLRLIIEENEFISPSNYFLIRNISLIFTSLNSSKYFLEKWYELVKNKKSKRVCMIHGNLELNHILGEENKFLISWDNAHNDLPIYDLLIFYKKHYHELNFYDLFNTYEETYPLTIEEKYLLFSYMLIPEKNQFNKEEILNTRDVFYTMKYLNISNDIISKNHSTDADSQAYEFNK